MATRKLSDKLEKMETLICSSSGLCQTDHTKTSSSRVKKKRRSTVQFEGSKKFKKNKSKDKQICSDKPKPRSNARKRTRINDLFDDAEAEFSVKERAEKVLARLENEFPHFLKCMLPSNVAHGFWLHLPKNFCSVHLPHHDTSIVLVDEWGNEYKTSYLLERHGLSAGWRGFSISHRLLKGDILIFHLTEPCKLKVHIVRVNGPDVFDAALNLMNINTSGGGTNAGLEKKGKRKHKKTKFIKPFHPAPSENVKGEDALSPITGPVSDQSAHSDNFSSKLTEGSEVTNQPRSSNLRYPETSFLHGPSCEGVTCR